MPFAPCKGGQKYRFALGLALSQLFRNAGHLIRPALVLLVGLGVFLLIRVVIVPKDFGKYGHYRANVLESIRARPVA